MLRPQETRFWQAALQSGLTTAERLEACWAEIPPDKRTPDAIDRRLARRAVEVGLMSRWQAQQLLAGVKPQMLWYDRYALVDLLGQGGMGRVFLARDSRLNRLVALKVLSRERMNNPRAVARFRREARVGAQLQHENLVRIYDEGETAGHLYLVMEYIDGKTAGHLIAERGPIPAGIAARIARQVALGLEHIAQKGLLHRDVNPQNILIARDGTAKLTDMGLAIDLGDEGDPVTRDGATVGTFDYISPEQARSSRQLDIRSDLYSLGCTVYHMLSGRLPFLHPSLAEKLYAHQALDPTPLSEVVTGIPLGLERVVQRLLAKLPENRYPTPREVAEALKPFQGPPMTLEAIENAPEIPVWIGADDAEDGSALAEAPTRDLKAAEPAAPARPVETAPAPEAAGSDIFGVITRINTGPITPLSETSSSSGKRSTAEDLPTRIFPVGGVVLAVLAALILAVVGLLAVFGLPGSRTNPPTTEPGSHRHPKGGAPSASKPSVKPAGPLRNPVTIHWLDDLTETAEMSLETALSQVTNRNDAEIVVREPLELGSSPITVSRGTVVLRAGEGTHPVVKARWDGKHPVFKVLLNGGLKLVGLTFECAPEEGSKEPTLIETASSVTLDHDTFVTSGEGRHLKVVASTGQYPTISACEFRGLDRPLHFDILTTWKAQLVQCLFVRQGDDGAAGPPIVVSCRKADSRPHELLIDRCTVAGQGLLALDGVTPDHPLVVEVRGSVVRGPVLVSWRGEANFPSGLGWKGQGNLYDISGPAWVRAGDRDQIPNAPTDLAAWRLVTGTDADGKQGHASFQGEADPAPFEGRPATAFILAGDDARTIGFSAEPPPAAAPAP
jgi:serine/threonine protein kinase